MRKLLLTFMAMALMALAQSQPPAADGISPANNWPTYTTDPTGSHYTPNGQIPLQYCAWTVDSNGNKTPLPGVVVTLSTHTVQYSGYHNHETNPNSGRPQAFPIVTGVLSDGWTQQTNSLGCAFWTAQLPGYSGYYTFEAAPQPYWDVTTGTTRNLPVKGLNFYAEYYVDAGPSAGALQPYPDNTALNVPQLAYIDSGHRTQSSRFFTWPVVEQIIESSVAYQDAMDARSVVPIGGYKLNVLRGSLHDGGIADNWPSFQYGWTTWQPQDWEEHGIGTEVDVINPAAPNADPSIQPIPYSDLVVLAAFADNSCFAGEYAPNTMTKLSDPDSYWRSLTYMHIACKNAFKVPGAIHGH